jgi:uncharacterized OB-fold protein
MAPADNDRIEATLPDGLWTQPEVSVPEGVITEEAVQRICIPARLEYTYRPGTAQSRFLFALKEKKILGGVCPESGDVYTPPRGISPVAGKRTTEYVEIGPKATVSAFCVVHIGFGVNAPEPPFVSALILPDGAAVSLYGLIQEIPYDQVRIGMRLEPVWVDDDDLDTSFENIRWWRPIDEPDVDPALLKGHI